MNPSVWIDPRLALVGVDGVRSYMLSHGWRLQPYPEPELLVFGGLVDDDGEPVFQVLPASEHLRDYRMRLEELIGALAVMEERLPSDIVSDILRLQAPSTVPPSMGVNGAGSSGPPP